MANLYEIKKEILNCRDPETGEIIDEAALMALTIERDLKVENVALWIKNLAAEAKAYKDEKDAFAQRQKTAENKAESLKKYLGTALEGQKFKSTRVSVSYRRSESVECDDLGQVDDEYLKYREPDINKVKIKEAIKAGIQVDGCKLVEKQNIQIR